MGEVRPIPVLGGVIRDVRGAGRALRVSWHSADGIVVLSLWRGADCTGTVRLAAHDVPELIEALHLGLEPTLLEPPPPLIAAVPEIGPTVRPPAPVERGPEPLDGPGGTATG